MFKSIWKSMDGKKLAGALLGVIVFYGIPWCRAKWPYLPWDEVIIPILAGLGITGVGHRVVKAVPDTMLPEKWRTGTSGWRYLMGNSTPPISGSQEGASE